MEWVTREISSPACLSSFWEIFRGSSHNYIQAYCRQYIGQGIYHGIGTASHRSRSLELRMWLLSCRLQHIRCAAQLAGQSTHTSMGMQVV